ncbi:DUF6456 domain-containing protein [Chenggangzhangella methanolivorans]|uniref:DUF6456 domain-containing protein n=1 Tax=Chenggangzhangella methanolivorans TaxID=1437009 RepID=UPI00360664D8
MSKAVRPRSPRPARSAGRAGPQAAPSLTRLPPVEARLLARVAAAGEAGIAAPASEAARGLGRRGLVEELGGRLVATETGRARVAREAAGPEGLLAQHRRVERRAVETGNGHEHLLVDLDESPLAWLARRKGRDGRPLLAVAEVAAGERLRADFTRAQMGPRVTANWEAAVSSGRRGGGAGDLGDAALAAKARVARALEAVGPELSGALLDVCCFLKGLEEVERERGWPARGAKLVLGLGLARLARHYGLVAEGRGPGRIVSWGAERSRPTIDGA